MPPMAPWEKVYIKLPRSGNLADLDHHFEELSCVDCHGGDKTQNNNKEKAHKGLIQDPSEFTTVDGKVSNSCAGEECHTSTAEEYHNSLHQQLWGERKYVALRSGVSSFDQCPQSTRDGFNGECTSCHATCGDCHISIPNSAGKGLVNDHRFQKTPNMEKNCTACHGSRVAFDFYGEEGLEERQGDVHFKTLYMDCFDCHNQSEMHTRVTDTDNTDRYTYDLRPSCFDCHPADSIATINLYHTMHMDNMTCYVCHSQKYNNCSACHVKGEWKTDPDYQENNPHEDFKIGLNPLPAHRDFSDVKYAVVRHIPIAPDTYENWGSASANLPDYNTIPTWKFASPHSIQRWTPRTDASPCYNNCHTKEGFGKPENKEIFLFRAEIQEKWPDEVQANDPVVVDGNLPDGWE